MIFDSKEDLEDSIIDSERLDALAVFVVGQLWTAEFSSRFEKQRNVVLRVSRTKGYSTIREAIDAFLKHPC